LQACSPLRAVLRRRATQSIEEGRDVVVELIKNALVLWARSRLMEGRHGAENTNTAHKLSAHRGLSDRFIAPAWLLGVLGWARCQQRPLICCSIKQRATHASLGSSFGLLARAWSLGQPWAGLVWSPSNFQPAALGRMGLRNAARGIRENQGFEDGWHSYGLHYSAAPQATSWARDSSQRMLGC